MSGNSNSTIRLSVALVTRNRPASLERCLQSWRSQSVAPFELVVSDDSDDSCRLAIEELTCQHGGIYTPGPRRGLYANRNQASLLCRGTHILSADDDHTHPEDYLEKIMRVAATDPERIWIFGERHPDQPDAPLTCPPELGRSGFGCAPLNPHDCAAIADGATVYPRRVFDSGLRYDETYPFGGMWYLWGRWLVKNGWRISFSDAAFVWHHVKEKPEGSLAELRQQLAAACYVQFVRSLWLEPSLSSSAWSCLCLLRRVCCIRSGFGFGHALAVLRKAIKAKSLYSASRPGIVSSCRPAAKFRTQSSAAFNL